VDIILSKINKLDEISQNTLILFSYQSKNNNKDNTKHNNKEKKNSSETKIVEKTPYKVNSFSKNINELINDAAQFDSYNAEFGQILKIHTNKKINSKKLIVIGLGKEEDVDAQKLRQIGHVVVNVIKGLKETEIFAYIENIKLKDKNIIVKSFTEGLILSDYSFNKYKTKDVKNIITITNTIIIADYKDLAKLRKKLR